MALAYTTLLSFTSVGLNRLYPNFSFYLFQRKICIKIPSNLVPFVVLPQIMDLNFSFAIFSPYLTHELGNQSVDPRNFQRITMTTKTHFMILSEIRPKNDTNLYFIFKVCIFKKIKLYAFFVGLIPLN